jgi:hypothetical protein
MPETPSAASTYLVALANRIAVPYGALSQAKAILLTGSASEGLSDQFSDIDMSIYYDVLPSDDDLATARQHNGGSERLWLIGDRNDDSFAEAYLVHGVECQIGHTTVAAWQRDIAQVLEQLDVTSPLQKALDGTLHGIALYGAPLIQQWQARLADYPDALVEAMVAHYLSFFPIWYLEERFTTRDASLWRQQILVETAQHILGVLAGLNRLYYSTFQFKRMRRFIAQMPIVPPRLADRLEQLFVLDPPAAIAQLETLVGETVGLVEQHIPQVDTSRVRARLGRRQQPWQPVDT